MGLRERLLVPEQYPLQSTPQSFWRATRPTSVGSSTARGLSTLAGAATTAELTVVASARVAVVTMPVRCMLLDGLGWSCRGRYACGVLIVDVVMTVVC